MLFNGILPSICHRTYFHTSKGHVTWIIKKVNRIPTHCGVAYESVRSLARGHMIKVWMASYQCLKIPFQTERIYKNMYFLFQTIQLLQSLQYKAVYFAECIGQGILNVVYSHVITSSCMPITWPWPRVGKLCHDLITLRQKETWK